jgi:CheY-like chemotaxis protein
VLIVDDEPMICRLMAAMLEGHYRIVVATGGREALALFADPGHDISAVVTDIRMPGMDGLALASALRDRGVTIPIMFVSGFSVIGEAPGPLLRKPFVPEDLLASVRRLLEPSDSPQ